MWLFPESGPKKGLSGNGFTKTVTSHLRSIVPNVQRHMAYFASCRAMSGLEFKPSCSLPACAAVCTQHAELRLLDLSNLVDLRASLRGKFCLFRRDVASQVKVYGCTLVLLELRWCTAWSICYCLREYVVVCVCTRARARVHVRVCVSLTCQHVDVARQ